MNFQLFGSEKAPTNHPTRTSSLPQGYDLLRCSLGTPTLLLIPGLGVSYEIFLPLIRLTEDKSRIIAAEVDGFTFGRQTRFTSVLASTRQAKKVCINYQKYSFFAVKYAEDLVMSNNSSTFVIEMTSCNSFANINN